MSDDASSDCGPEFTSLQTLCARAVGLRPRTCIYQHGMTLADLPSRLQEDVTQWISAAQLMQLDRDIEGIKTDALWQRHAEQRWLHRRPSQRNPFRLGLVTWRQFYIDEHFKESLNYCSNDFVKYIRRLGEDPKRTFNAPLVDVPKYRYQDPPPGYKDFSNANDLKALAPLVRTLSISFRQLHYIEMYPELLHALSHSIETLILQNLSTRGSLAPLKVLLFYGRRLKYLDVVNCIWDDVMMSMMSMMSGQLSGVETAKVDSELSEEARKNEKDACFACAQCQDRKRTYQPYQVPNFCVENSTIHPISDSKFVRILRGWTDLEEFIHMCYPLSTPRVEQETIGPLMDTLVYLARSRKLTRIHLNGPYHMSVFNMFTHVTVGQVAPVNDIAYNTLIHCHVGCQLAPRDSGLNGKRTRSPAKARNPGIITLELNSVHCDAVLRPVIFKPIVEIVATDSNLRHLSMQSCRQFPDNLILLFRAITKAKLLISLDITGNYVQRSAFGDLIAMIKKCDSLRTLVVDYCELPTRESYVQELASAVAKSALSTVSVANNRLGEYAAQMVVDILREQNGDRNRLRSLNVSQNCIKFEAVEAMCSELIKLRKECDQTEPLISFLSLDDVLEVGADELTNKMGQLSRMKVVGNVVSRNNLLQAARATILGYVSQM